MTVRRVMGTETEYAVSYADGRHANPVQLSFDVVDAAATPERRHIRWDYRQEDPVNDMRGTRLERAAARPDMLTDTPQATIVNTIAANGGRVYVDHAHPEYAAPETLDPFDAVRYDHAGDRIMLAAARAASARTGTPIALHRNNVDGKGASWGTHENYTTDRAIPFDTLARLMTIHLTTRQIYTGSGRVGIGEHGEAAGYQLSQRADYIHMTIGLQTTFDRPIINTRDEPHGPAGTRRLHIIVGDANRMDVPQTLKLGVTSMILWLAEHAAEAGYDLDTLIGTLEAADPVAAMHTISHDLTLSAPITLAAGGTTTAWQTQVTLRAAVYATAAAIHGTDVTGEPAWPDRSTKAIMTMWGQALTDTAAIRHADDDARLAMADEARRVEWLFKWQLLERLRRRGPLDWADARLAALDLSWAALDPATSVYAKLASRTERVNSDADETRAMTEAPADTRAWLRAAIAERYPGQVVAASWSRLTVRVDAEDTAGADGGEADRMMGGTGESYGNASRRPTPMTGIMSLDMTDPLAFTRERCERVVDDCPSAARVVSELDGNIPVRG